MKLVIDIDDDSYEHIKAFKNEDVLPMGWYAISHGTPLTKVDCISRQAVLDIINFEDKWLLDAKSNNANTDIAFSTIKSKLSKMPSVTPKGVTITDFADKCRECGREKVLDKISAEIAMYEADCRLQGGTDVCEKCNSNVFGSIYRIIDKYKTESEE